MSPKVQALIDGIIAREGGDKFTDHPSDAGGPTRFGVTEKTARAYGYEGPMASLPREKAVEIYRAIFVKPYELLEPISARVFEECVDTEVNLRPGVAAEFLQHWLNALNKGATLYPDQAVDGRVGLGTAGALKAYLAARGAEGERVLLRALNASQACYYLARAEARPANEDFLYGWVKERCIDREGAS